LKNCNIFFPVSLLTEKDREELAVGLIVDVKYQCSKTIAVESLRCKVNKKQISCVNPGIIIDISDGKKSSERVEQLKNYDHEVDEDEAVTDYGDSTITKSLSGMSLRNDYLFVSKF
jgi:hypothetical protein